jgi:hypothetical protein
MKVAIYPTVKFIRGTGTGKVVSEKRNCNQPRARKTGHKEAAERVTMEKKDLPYASFAMLLQALNATLSWTFRA